VLGPAGESVCAPPGQRAKNPYGREIRFGRGIRLTKRPQASDDVGKLDVFNAPTVHLDEVDYLPPGTTVLASNAVSACRPPRFAPTGRSPGSAYHPDIRCANLAAIVRVSARG